jgi:hypothetical protein
VFTTGILWKLLLRDLIHDSVCPSKGGADVGVF